MVKEVWLGTFIVSAADVCSAEIFLSVLGNREIGRYLHKKREKNMGKLDSLKSLRKCLNKIFFYFYTG